MKSRAPWILVATALIALVVIVAVRRRPAVSSPVSIPAKNAATAAAQTEVVPIQDGKTIDFSPGFPVVKDSEGEKAIIARATKQMEDASRGVTFESPKPAPAEAGKK
ncbi:MAG: hypothetical protein ABIZ49_12645 [Opitutaceae bacterium]